MTLDTSLPRPACTAGSCAGWEACSRTKPWMMRRMSLLACTSAIHQGWAVAGQVLGSNAAPNISEEVRGLQDSMHLNSTHLAKARGQELLKGQTTMRQSLTRQVYATSTPSKSARKTCHGGAIGQW